MLFMPMGAMGILPNFSAVGCLLSLAALKRLNYYCPACKGFRAAVFTLIPQTVASLLLFILGMLGWGIGEKVGAAAIAVTITELVCDVLTVITSVCLFLGIHRLSGEVDLPNLTSRSVRMLSFTVAYGLLACTSGIAELVSGFVTKARIIVAFNYINLAVFLLEYVFIFLCLLFFFTCYMRICLEGDEGMPYRDDIFDKIIACFKKNKRQ